jgi:hypothetical protein
MLWRIISVALTLACAGCASPSSKEAADFGKAASDTLAIISDSRTAEIDLIREAGAERRACDYLTQGKINLRPPLDSKGSKLVQEQLALLKAITEYAKALSDATDPQGNTDLEAAGTKLAAATTSFATPALSVVAPSISSSPVIGPAITLLSAVAIDIVELETRARLRAVIEANRLILDLAVQRIRIDAAEVERLVRDSYSRWASAKACNLRVLRAGNETVNGNAPLYSVYKDADAAAHAFLQRLTVLDVADLAKALEALVKAHDALLANDIDFQLANQKLKEIVADLQALNKAASAAATPKPATNSTDTQGSAADATKG